MVSTKNIFAKVGLGMMLFVMLTFQACNLIEKLAEEGLLDPVANLTVTDNGSGDVVFKWDAASGATSAVSYALYVGKDRKAVAERKPETLRANLDTLELKVSYPISLPDYVSTGTDAEKTYYWVVDSSYYGVKVISKLQSYTVK
ncbi:hypothetical protein P0082_04675 [Candidatus Haliotispira prima]|uniref:Lipoprotein n=1 Tax=Candidatus Haliotispira prima TaxID=3034016 RepID=A0ABY8MJG1_9SPIO|nr:hypothetical protein P0082_04675 [Candidatus Haliotispira prima]